MCGAELQTREAAARAVLATVPDPELPTLNLVDLGIVREVRCDADGQVQVVLTPTYSGCPATEAITQSVHEALNAAGLGPARVSQRLAPAWTTDWISEAGKAQMRASGIVPPGPVAAEVQVVRLRPRALACPRCGSLHTERLSAFGSTACKALHRCLACHEPFEHFKPL